MAVTRECGDLGRDGVARGLPPRERGIGEPTSPSAVRASPAPATDEEAAQRRAGDGDDVLGLPCTVIQRAEGDATDVQDGDSCSFHACMSEARYDGDRAAIKMLAPDCAATGVPLDA